MSVTLQSATNGGSFTYTYPPSSGEFALKQDYKTIAGVSILGMGDITLKTINGVSVQGTGDITISAPASLDLGEFSNLAALIAAHPAGTTGQYARVRTSLRTPPKVLWWDVQNATWDTLGNSLSLGASAATLAGRGNIAAGEGAVVLGGGTLTAPSGAGFIPSEQIAANQANGWCNLIGSGTGNVTNGICSSVLNGQLLTVDAALSTIINGKSSSISGTLNLVGTGVGNRVLGATQSVILNGNLNTIEPNGGENTNYRNVIINGSNISLRGVENTVISGGLAALLTTIRGTNNLISNVTGGANLVDVTNTVGLGLYTSASLSTIDKGCFLACTSLGVVNSARVVVLGSTGVSFNNLSNCVVLSSSNVSPRVNQSITRGLAKREDHKTILIAQTSTAETIILHAPYDTAGITESADTRRVVHIPNNSTLTGTINLTVREEGTNNLLHTRIRVIGSHSTSSNAILAFQDTTSQAWLPGGTIIPEYNTISQLSINISLASAYDSRILITVTSTVAKNLKAIAVFDHQIICDI